MKPFDHTKFIGYICEVTPQYVRMQIPSARLINSFYLDGNIYLGGAVGGFVVIEGQNIGFLGRISELNLPQSERTELTERDFIDGNPTFHPMAKIELLAIFNQYKPRVLTKTVSRFPCIGAKVYSCSDEQIGAYISSFGSKNDDNLDSIAPIGILTSNNTLCNISLNSLFGRHCAVLGTTGGGKSWTVARLIELISENTENKCIIIDAVGEYQTPTETTISVVMGTGDYIFDYHHLSIDELFFLLHPSSKTQVPKLMEAIRSLKMIELDESNQLQSYYLTNPDGSIIKSNLHKYNKEKRPYEIFKYRNLARIEDNSCNFNFRNLATQITMECLWDTHRNIANSWGDRNDTDVSNCVSLISRVNNIYSTSEYNQIFGFNKDALPNAKDLMSLISEFFVSDKSILRLDFSKVSFDFQVREILVNAIGQYLLNTARNSMFLDKPVVVFIDEAHQFLNKNIADEYFTAKPLDAFEKISKEARKYGLFLCIATQMPRDIPLGTLSQMGAFIVHRLINEQDKKAVESAASSANRNSLAFLPVLGEGEALVVGVDFPMPLTIKITPPHNKPNSGTPKLKSKIINNDSSKNTSK